MLQRLSRRFTSIIRTTLTAYTTTVSARALLTLTKHVNASSVSPGDRIVYRIVVTNSGPSAAPLTISDSAPISLTDLVVSSSAGGCTSLPCAVASLAPNAVVTVYVAATVAQTVTGAFVNSANVTTTAELVDGSSTADDCHGQCDQHRPMWQWRSVRRRPCWRASASPIRWWQ
jgi:uncharacterized repeat protein (TIGR01451 family)